MNVTTAIMVLLVGLGIWCVVPTRWRIWVYGNCDRCGKLADIARPKGGAIGGLGPKWCGRCLHETNR